MDKVRAYAVIEDGKINVPTISNARRAAIVNWLVVEANLMIYSKDTDEYIKQLWEENKRDATIIEVEVSPLDSPSTDKINH